MNGKDEAINYAQKFTTYGMLECFKLRPIMLLVYPSLVPRLLREPGYEARCIHADSLLASLQSAATANF